MRLRTMTLFDGTSGSAPAGKCGFLSRKHPVCPAPASAATGAPSYSFGAVLKAADVTSAQPGSARCGFAQPRLNLTGQRSYRMSSSEAGLRPATSRSGGGYGLWPATAPCKSSPLYRRHLGNPCAEKVLQNRARQNNVSEPALVADVGDHWQGTLTLTGSNVRLGTEMPVALSLFQ